jgi:hypothetical protein
MQKRGALELSVNTIVIVVIGVALLSLGLIFVRNTFGGLTKMSDDIFGTAETTISKLHSGARLTLPTSVDVKQGEVVRLNAFVGNDGTRCTVNNFALTATLSAGSSSEIGVKPISPSPVTIKPGEEGTFVIAVGATKSAPLATGGIDDPSVSVTVTCGTEVYDTSAFTINVQKGGGLFS